MSSDTPPTPASVPLRSIAEVERDTGLARATVRIWERRYGFPAPLRDDRGGGKTQRQGETEPEQPRVKHECLSSFRGHDPPQLESNNPNR